MDPSYFGLEGHPFRSAQQERETGFLPETHSSLVTELKAGLKAPHGITLLIGEEGTGKTTLVRRFADDLADDCTVAYLPTTGPGLRHLLTETIEQLGGSPPPSGDEQALLDCLGALARARAQHGRTTLVVVDDAHDLPAKTIERVGRLFGEDPADPSMLHVVLVGRPELLDRMNAANDRTILKHLVQVCRMDPIGPEESFRYIADRIAKVGGVVDKLFTEDALRMIVKRANGNPGRIHAICSAAMSQAAESGEDAVAADTVDLACIGVDGFTIDGSQTKGGDNTDPMQYIFGEEEVNGDKPSEPLRLLPVNGAKEHTVPVEATPLRRTAAPSSALDRLKELVPGLGENHRRLGLWAAGLVAVLVGFAAAMTGSEQTASPPAELADERLAAANKTAADAAVEADPLPSSAVRTSRLVVKREGAAEPPAANASAEPTPAAASEPASVAALPAPAMAAGDGDRPRVQAPPYVPSPAASSPSPPAANVANTGTSPTTGASSMTDTSLSAAAATATGAAAKDERAPEPAGAPAAKAASAGAKSQPPAAKAAPEKAQTPPAPSTKPVELAAAQVPKETPAVVTTKAAAVQTPSSQSAAAASTTSKYTVQVGAFKSRDNAEALLDQIRKSYPDGRIVITQSGSSPVFRVFSGAFASKGDADTRARTLAENGFTTFVRDIPR